jgi:hypothetical protein
VGVFGPIDFAHTAHADLFGDAVVAHGAADEVRI